MRVVTRAFLLTVAILAGAELSLRIFNADYLAGRTEYGYSPRAGIVEKDGVVRLKSGGGRRFWKQSFRNPKPPGLIRIVTVGDSIARGSSLKDSFPWMLGETLKQSGLRVESLNLASTGFGSARKRIVARQALEFQPDLLVLHIPDSNEYEDERDWKRKEDLATPHPRNWFMQSWLIHRMYEWKTEQLFWKLPQAVRNTRSVNDADAEVAASLNAATRVRWRKDWEANTRATVAEALSHRVPVIVLTYLVLHRESTGERLDDDGTEAFARTLAGPMVEVVSPREAFREGEASPYFFRDGGHWLPPGHAKIAAALVPHVRRMLARASSPASP
jgi:hypothetical protein